MGESPPAYRPDIDGLRAVAVLLVIVYHAFPSYLPGGFIGVDVFFVISGYLITAILRGQPPGLASLGAFYARRVRRIFPALIVVLAAVMAAASLLLLPDEMARLKRDAAAAALFAANIRFWQDAGYFDVLERLKPLLHLWSLGIEEQFYLLWPPVIWLLARRSRNTLLWGVCVIVAVSLALNLALVVPYPVTTFYLLPTRMWELGLGAILACTQGWRGMPPAWRAPLALGGLALIAAAALAYRATIAFPGAFALLPTLGAAAVIAAGGGNPAGTLLLANAPMNYLGRISYPLYLTHWPLLSFLAIIAYRMAHWPWRLAMLALALVLAALICAFVEKPIRARRARGPLLGGLLAAMALLAAAAFVLPVTARPGTADAALEWNYAENTRCDARHPWPFRRGWWFCELSADRLAQIILLGDSHANHLYPGLLAAFPDRSILSIGTCPPLDDIRTNARNVGEIPCASDLQLRQIAFLHGVVEQEPQLRLAILAAQWPLFTASGAQADYASGEAMPPSFDLVVPDGRFAHPSQRDAYLVGLDRRIAFLEQRGLKVILFLASPTLPYDVRQCISRPYFPATQDCSFSASAWQKQQASFRAIAAALRRMHPGLELYDPVRAFCRLDRCRLIQGDKVYLRDDNHLSEAGSAIVAADFRRWLENRQPGDASR